MLAPPNANAAIIAAVTTGRTNFLDISLTSFPTHQASATIRQRLPPRSSLGKMRDELLHSAGRFATPSRVDAPMGYGVSVRLQRDLSPHERAIIRSGAVAATCQAMTNFAILANDKHAPLRRMSAASAVTMRRWPFRAE